MARIETTADTTAARPRDNIVPGIAVGIAGAVIMGLVYMIVAGATGAGFWTPMMLIGATYIGAQFTSLPIWAAVLGVGTHLAVGAAFGVLFVALARRIANPAAKLAAGLAYGAGVYLFMTFLVMPWANPVMYVAVDKGIFFLVHLAYGLVLPLALPMRRGVAVARRREVY